MTAPAPTPDRYLTPADLVVHLGARGVHVSVETVCRWLRAGALPGRQLGPRWVTPAEHLARWEAGLPTITDPAMASALRAIEEADIHATTAAGTIPSPLVRRRAA